MQIVQIVPTLAYGDAIGNDVLALKRALEEAEYDTEIYTESVVAPLKSSMAKSVEKLNLKNDDVAILHLSTGARVNRDFAKLACRKIIRYHNVTPPEFYAQNNPYIERINKAALKDVAFLADKVDYCLAVSEFNKQGLIEMGYTCKIDVLPILIPFEDYNKVPDPQILKTYRDVPIVLFTGRIVPNKKLEDVIRAFFMYKKYYNKDAVLILIGSYKEEDKYYQSLQAYINKINAQDIVFTGHIRFDEILAYYRVADVFLCQSEHEGFCVPLVEAMYFGIPIVAYASTAIPGTLSGSGIVMDTKEPLMVAGMINRVYTDKKLKEEVLLSEQKRLEDFAYKSISEHFLKLIEKYIQNG